MESDRAHDRAERLDRAAVRPPGRRLTAEEVRDEVAPRLTPARLSHVEAVVETIGLVTARWGANARGAALRAGWLHDAWRCAPAEEALAEIRARGEEPDPWALRHAPVLLHAQAAAVWAESALGEADPHVLGAVRHHSSGHPDWGPVGLALYVADFCEPTRAFATELRTDRLIASAAAGQAPLAAAALEVLRLRLEWAIRDGRQIHPDSVRAWNAWLAAGVA
jgi:predicted HD superfamily hydrolase involved in NAD metabolism